MRKLFFLSPRKQTATMPQSKPKNKLLNRIFAITFAFIILTYLYFLITRYGPTICIVPGSGYLIILVGLLVETWKPSLDFTFHRNRRWIFISIILFAVVVLNSVYWWIACGIPNWLPQYGWSKTIIEYLMGSFAVETSSLSLMFGILFLTRSTPQKSLSYKIMLIGVVIFEALFCIPTIILGPITGTGPPNPNLPQYKDFWGYTIFQPWFWLDSVSEIVIFIGAVQLLRRAMNIKKLILVILILFIVLSLLHI